MAESVGLRKSEAFERVFDDVRVVRSRLPATVSFVGGVALGRGFTYDPEVRKWVTRRWQANS